MQDRHEEDLRSKNVNTVQQVYAAFAKRDINAILSMLSPDIEWGEPPNPFNPAGGTRHGHEGFLEWLNIGRQSEEILVLEPRKFLTDRDSVAVVGFTRCLAKPTGKSYETDFVHVVTIREGKIVRFQEFFDTYAAAEAFRQG
jgi:ketosteroid isomerase-like protein